MKLENIKAIQFSLLKKEQDLEVGLTEYTKKITAKFEIPKDFPKTQQMFELLVQKIYNDLMEKKTKDVDSLGLWIEIDNDILENAISLQTLDDIQHYSSPDVNSVFEFFKMTFPE